MAEQPKNELLDVIQQCLDAGLFTQHQLAETAGFSDSHLSHFLRGRRVPNNGHIDALLNALRKFTAAAEGSEIEGALGAIEEDTKREAQKINATVGMVQRKVLKQAQSLLAQLDASEPSPLITDSTQINDSLKEIASGKDNKSLLAASEQKAWIDGEEAVHHKRKNRFDIMQDPNKWAR